MKNLIVGLVMSLGLAAFGSETLTTTYGIMKITSSSPEVIIAVPFCEAGGAPMSPSNLVMTANLTVGDELYYYNGSDFDCWRLLEGDGGVKYWTSVTEVDAKSVKLSVDPGTTELPAGSALVLKRQNPTTSDVANSFYLIGQVYPSSKELKTVIPANCAKTLIAPPIVGDDSTKVFDFNTDVTWQGVDSEHLEITNEVIKVADGVIAKDCRYRYIKDDKGGGTWQWRTGLGWKKSAQVRAGEGFWYVNPNNASRTIIWAPPESK